MHHRPQRLPRRHFHQQPGSRIQPANPRQYPSPHPEHRIGAVITAARGHNLASTLPPHIEYLYIPAVDHESFDISKYFATAHQLLEEELPRTNVLVHCMAGVSRSATLVIAYLMRARGMSLETAFAVVKKRRPIVCVCRGRLVPIRHSLSNLNVMREV